MHVSSQARNQDLTPTLIVSGFLGSGKTTIISHLIEVLQQTGQQVAYIKNEIGDEALDSKVLQGQNIQSKELLNGCICCTLVGPFRGAITELVETFSPDLIIIEASGAADPAAIALMVDSHPAVVRDSVVSIVDVINFTGYKDLSTTARNQTRFTDLIIFNKIELADDQQKQAVVGYVRELNEHSPIIEAPNGKISPSVVLGANLPELSRLLATYAANQDNHELEHHVEEDNFSAFHLAVPDAVNQARLTEYLKSLPRRIIRVKGLVKTELGLQICNGIAGRITFSPAPKVLQQEKSLLTFIGIAIDEYEEEVKVALENAAMLQ